MTIFVGSMIILRFGKTKVSKKRFSDAKKQ